jgi:hypothetical protein
VSGIRTIEAKIVEILKGVPGIKDADDHEPKNVPRTLPYASILLTRYDPVDAETSTGQDVTYGWKLSLYIALNDFERAQATMKDLLPEVGAAFREHPTADNLVDELRLSDPGVEPAFVVAGAGGGGYLRKELQLTAVQIET